MSRLLRALKLLAPLALVLHALVGLSSAAPGAPVAFEWFEYNGRDPLFAEPLGPGVQNETHYFFLGVRRLAESVEVFLERANSKAPSSPEMVARAILSVQIGRVSLRIAADGKAYSFLYQSNEGQWRTLREGEDGRILSTASAGGFVGAYLGPYARLDE
jgi:hypothetical protein